MTPYQLFEEAQRVVKNLDPGMFTSDADTIAYARLLVELGAAELEFERGARPGYRVRN